MRVWPRRRDTAERKLGCAEVIRVLQQYLDGETDEATARGAAAHLDDCRRCGMEAALYREIKKSLARQQRPDARAVERLHGFGESLLYTGPGDRGECIPGW
ncbi:zf-HC2 domain-containing protein [Streptomyces canus]|uniref:zf-HC2 domain-containing protein n=1 Tax=Streptomyces canus TaxID=58343 RepID=UPI003813572E